MAKNYKQKKKNKEDISELKDLEELAQFRKKKKIQNEALKKIIDNLNAPDEYNMEK